MMMISHDGEVSTTTQREKAAAVGREGSDAAKLRGLYKLALYGVRAVAFSPPREPTIRECSKWLRAEIRARQPNGQW